MQLIQQLLLENKMRTESGSVLISTSAFLCDLRFILFYLRDHRRAAEERRGYAEKT